MKTEITLFKFWLTGQKQKDSIHLSPHIFQYVHSLFIQIFGLSDYLTGDVDYDQYTIVELLTKKVYSDVYGIQNFDNDIPYSFINLYTFFSHMFMNANDPYIITTYQKQSDLCIISNSYTQECLYSDLAIKQKNIIQDTPFIKVYASDFYPGFTFKSDEEKETEFDFSDMFDCFVTISTNRYLVSIDEKGSWVTIPTFDTKLRQYLYLKYSELYNSFLPLYNIKQQEFLVLPGDKDIINQYGFSQADLKRGKFSGYDLVKKYIEEILILLDPNV